jgi:integrase
MTTFNPKLYKEKKRIYSPTNTLGISRLWVWNENVKEYRPPSSGKPFIASRYETNLDGMKARRKEFFETLESAKSWQDFVELKQIPKVSTMSLPVVEVVTIPAQATVVNAAPVSGRPPGKTLAEIRDEWKKRKLAFMKETTKARYGTLLRLYFNSLYQLSIYDITPQRIDKWLEDLKNPESWTMKSTKRKNFKYELSLLKLLLSYYQEYYDDPYFSFPIKDRHNDDIYLGRSTNSFSKDLRPEEFLKFRKELEKNKFGRIFAPMATVQYAQALRISEAAAIHFEDLQMNFKEPHKSRLIITRAIKWVRKAKTPPTLENFKNSEANAGVKEQPMFPECFEVLKDLYVVGGKGLIFHNNGEFFTYRSIQNAYDLAFKRAGLNKRGTHVMRHGGCRNLYDESGDIEVAKQHLGNSTLQTTLVYAKRSAKALTEAAHEQWKRSEVVATGCNPKKS